MLRLTKWYMMQKIIRKIIPHKSVDTNAHLGMDKTVNLSILLSNDYTITCIPVPLVIKQ